MNWRVMKERELNHTTIFQRNVQSALYWVFFSLSLESPNCWFYSTIWHFGSQFKANSWVYGPSQTGFTLTPTVTQAREIPEVLWLTCCPYISISMLFRGFYFPSCYKPVQRKSSRILSSCKPPLLIFFPFPFLSSLLSYTDPRDQVCLSFGSYFRPLRQQHLSCFYASESEYYEKEKGQSVLRSNGEGITSTSHCIAPYARTLKMLKDNDFKGANGKF